MKIKSVVHSFVIVVVFVILAISCKKGNDANNPVPDGTVTDIDGNVYHTVTIGTQVWMVENLKTTKYRNGDPIPNVSDGTVWGNLTTGAYCSYANNVNNSSTYGVLYNWFAVVDGRNLAPEGWHMPTDGEWTILTTFLGGESDAGGKLKESGFIHWHSPNTSANNITGFTALPGGWRLNNDGKFELLGSKCFFWSSSIQPYQMANGWNRVLTSELAEFSRSYYAKVIGLSVRCIKD